MRLALVPSHAGVLGALALAALPQGKAPSAPATEPAFVTALDQVDRLIAAGKAPKARELLEATLEANREQPWALYHLTEVLDDLKRTAFWSKHQRPDPKTLVSGELVSWSPTSGQIKVRYRVDGDGNAKAGPATGKAAGKLPAVFADFEQDEDGDWTHPLTFEGPFTVEVRGPSYPPMKDPPKTPGILVLTGWKDAVLVSFGLPEARWGTSIHWVPARVVRIDGGDVDVIAEEKVAPAAGREFDLKLSVSASSVTASSGGKKLLGAEKPSSASGQVVLQDFPRVTEIVLAGKAQPSWLQGLVDAEIQERWAEFEKTYDASADLPGWLREKAGTGAGAQAWPDDATPGAREPADQEAFEAFEKALNDGGTDAALAFARKVPDAKPGLRDWFLALAFRIGGNDVESLQACSRVCTADPRFLPARTMCVGLEADIGGVDAAIKTCRVVVEDFPEEPGPYRELASLQMIAGRVDEAEATIRAAIDAGVPAKVLGDAQHLVTRARKGPLWARAYEYKSEHYTVTSDINQSLCFEAATLLEKFHDKFNVHLRRLAGKDRTRFRVHLFSGEAGYLAYSKDLTGRERKNTNGLYSPVVKQLLIWNLPDAAQMMKTIRHEGFHQYFDQLVGTSPVWLNEGLAEYYEGSKLVRGAWSDDEVNPLHVAVLREEGITSLRQFLAITPSTFYGPRVAQNYAQSWALVHFLLNGGAENEKRFDRMIDALVGGSSREAAVAAGIPDKEIAAFEKAFAKYVGELE